MTELVIKPEEFGINPKDHKEMVSGLEVSRKERDLLDKRFDTVSVLPLVPENIEKFRELRIAYQKNRTKGIDVWHKAQKEIPLRMGQFLDAIKRAEHQKNQSKEDVLLNAEKHLEIAEAERLSELQSEREALLLPYVENPEERDLSSMNDEFWEVFLKMKMDLFEAAQKKIAEEAALEAKRLADEEAEKARLKAENEKLQKEAEERERLAKIEQDKRNKIESERVAKETKEREVRIAKEELEAEKARGKLQAEREAREKVEAELKAKVEVEQKAKADEAIRIESERKEAEKLAKAPVKKQLNVWVDSFELPHLRTENETALLIKSKFEAFKKWAKSEITKL